MRDWRRDQGVGDLIKSYHETVYWMSCLLTELAGMMESVVSIPERIWVMMELQDRRIAVIMRLH
jgi:hypothetical protein